MKIKRFKYLKKKGITDGIMFDIVKYAVIPSFNISFDDVGCKTILLVPARKLFRDSKWELFLNILIREYGISKNSVEEAVNREICAYIKTKEEILNRLKLS